MSEPATSLTDSNEVLATVREAMRELHRLLAVSPYNCLYLDMHGLIFETSI
jgi:hypothetical protein